MIHDSALLAPVFALAAWTVCILLLVATRRVVTGRADGLGPGAYALGESDRVPSFVKLANRNYMNLLELPLLFYVACLLAVVTGVTSPALLALAWGYVALRVIHSLIHVTYNRVLHRFVAFGLSNVVLIAFWVLLGMQVFSARSVA